MAGSPRGLFFHLIFTTSNGTQHIDQMADAEVLRYTPAVKGYIIRWPMAHLEERRLDGATGTGITCTVASIEIEIAVDRRNRGDERRSSRQETGSVNRAIPC